VVVADSDLVVVTGVVIVDEDVVVAVVDVEEVERVMRRNGNPSPSWAVWSRLERSRAWRRSTFTLSPSRSIRSSTSSCPSSRMRL
jgi:hypothetical protein